MVESSYSAPGAYRGKSRLKTFTFHWRINLTILREILDMDWFPESCIENEADIYLGQSARTP